MHDASHRAVVGPVRGERVTETGRNPDVLVVGAQKSGTTTVHAWLRDYPQVFTATPKELHYFDLHQDRGPDWYRGRFAGVGPTQLAAEATPSYMYFEDAVRRIAQDLPDARLVVVLRDPVSRAYSHYQHNRSRGHEKLGFAAALESEPQRLATGNTMDRISYSYLDRGRYLGQVERLLSLFPRRQVHLELFECVRDEPQQSFERLTDFLELARVELPPTVGARTNRYKSARLRHARRLLPRSVRLPGAVAVLDRLPSRGYEPMTPAERRFLLEAYVPERDRLATMTGLDLSGWAR